MGRKTRRPKDIVIDMTMLTLPTPDVPTTASGFVKSLAGINRFKREELAMNVLLAGNVPTHMKSFVDVPITIILKDGTTHELVIKVLPDYLTIGTDTDSLRIPLFPTTGQKIADAWNCLLPTTKLVTLIWHAASSKIPPQPWGPPYDASMMSTERLVAHDVRIDNAIKKLKVDPLKLLAGHKKDVVITNQLVKKPKQVAIFGWHQMNGKPIQPLYLGHEAHYTDYSHGVRLLSSDCILDSQPDDLRRILQDPVLSPAISSEGPMQLLRYPNV